MRADASALERLALFAAELEAPNLPPEVLAKAKLCIVDALSACLTVGSTLEGDCAVALAAIHAASGPATIFGTRSTSSPADAAFVNAITAAGTARSDTHAATACHPGTVIIPAALALAEARHCSGNAVIAAIVGGYEVMCRLGLALITPEFAAIFRPTGMIAPTAAGIAAGRVIGLGPAQLANAASLATHTASGLNEWANSGTSELPYHSGFAARNGVDCALLAQAGMVSASTILEGKAGLLAGHRALERASRLTQGLGSGYKILEITHKPAPACIYVQTPCQLARRIVGQHDLDPDGIAAVEIRVSRPAASYPGCDDRGPIEDAQAAKLSIQFAVASVLVERGVFDANWRNFGNPRVNALAARSTVVVDDELTAASSARQGCGMKITLRSGESIESEQRDFVPMTDEDLVERFMNAAKPKLGMSRSTEILELVSRLEKLGDIRELTENLRL